ncbi:hypothetical protein BD779DRAFT_1668976 [Infundibulicybe gibba]|nr:hypothetical protein BD779DRAFT_1668976 [Infundibulicybe gibba]
MNLAANSYPILVAPRPVRLNGAQFARSYSGRLPASASDHFERVKITDASEDTEDSKVGLHYESTSEKDLASPRSSPRSGLPSEALEEFLSILRPPFFPPPSPGLRSRHQTVSSLPIFQPERSYSFKGRGRLEIVQQKLDLGDESDASRSAQPSRNGRTPESMHELEGVIDNDTFDSDTPPYRWFTSNLLSSPISRMHTRNPFLRHVSNQSPGLMSPLSPAAVPLPLPTPDELAEISTCTVQLY